MDLAGIRAAELVLRMADSVDLDSLDEILAILAWSGRAASALVVARERPQTLPRDRAQQAADVLYAAYEEHQDRAAQPLRFFETSFGGDSDYKQAEREPDERHAAQFYAGLAALALATLYRALGDPERQAKWLDRSRAPFLCSYRMFPPLVESRMVVTSSFIRREPTQADLVDYRLRCDALLAAYQAAYARLGA